MRGGQGQGQGLHCGRGRPGHINLELVNYIILLSICPGRSLLLSFLFSNIYPDSSEYSDVRQVVFFRFCHLSNAIVSELSTCLLNLTCKAPNFLLSPSGLIVK